MSKSRKIRFFFFVTTLLIVAAVIFSAVTKWWQIRKIDCSVTDSTFSASEVTDKCSADVQAELNKNVGKSLFLANLNGSAQRILQLDPELVSFTLQKSLPNQVHIQFQMSQEVYGVTNPHLPGFWINANGVATRELDGNGASESATLVTMTAATRSAVQSTTEFATASAGVTPTLPVIEVPDDLAATLRPGVQIDPTLHHQLTQLFHLLPAQNIQYQQVTITSPQEISLQIDGQKTALLRLDQLDSEVPKLAFVLHSVDFSTFKQSIHIIDMRFKYPVLK